MYFVVDDDDDDGSSLFFLCFTTKKQTHNRTNMREKSKWVLSMQFMALFFVG